MKRFMNEQKTIRAFQKRRQEAYNAKFKMLMEKGWSKELDD
jgi:hypothetical protein